MFRRITLAVMFVTTFGFASIATPDVAQAWRGWGRPYVSYYYGAPRAEYYGAPYGSYYRGWNGPRYYRGPVVYRSTRYYDYGYGYGYAPYYYAQRPGVSVAFRF